MVTAGESNIAVRFSEFEGMDTVMALKGQVQWIWVDCFSKLPLDRDVVMRQKEAGFKLCLVSPELQGRPLDVVPCRDRLREAGIIPDAVCSKRSLISTWEQP